MFTCILVQYLCTTTYENKGKNLSAWVITHSQKGNHIHLEEILPHLFLTATGKHWELLKGPVREEYIVKPLHCVYVVFISSDSRKNSSSWKNTGCFPLRRRRGGTDMKCAGKRKKHKAQETKVGGGRVGGQRLLITWECNIWYIFSFEHLMSSKE